MVVELLKEGHSVCSGLSHMPLQFLADQLTLSQPGGGGALCSDRITTCPLWIFRPCDGSDVAATSAGGYKMLAKISLLTLLLKPLPAKIYFVLSSSLVPCRATPRQTKPTGTKGETVSSNTACRRVLPPPPPLRRSRQPRPRLVSLLTSACLISPAEYGQKSW